MQRDPRRRSVTYFWPKIIPVLLSLTLNHSLDPLQGFGETVIHLDQGTLNNLRAGSTSIKEWDDFPDHVESSAMEYVFDAKSNASSWTLSLRQQNVKESWKVVLNEKELGRLVRDENDLRSDFENYVYAHSQLSIYSLGLKYMLTHNLSILSLTRKEKTQILKDKKADLDALSGESQEEEKKLSTLKAKAAKKVEPSLLHSYEKLVERQRNGLAVVKVSRGACGGCFNVVPAQRQAEIKEKKKIILCEYCGRILADVIAEKVIEKPKKRTSRKKAAPKKASAKK